MQIYYGVYCDPTNLIFKFVYYYWPNLSKPQRLENWLCIEIFICTKHKLLLTYNKNFRIKRQDTVDILSGLNSGLQWVLLATW